MLRESIRLGRVAGVRVSANISVLVIVAIIVVGLAVGRYPAVFPGHSVWVYVLAAVVSAGLFVLSLLAHEIAHAVVARRNGVDVEGITLWLFGGVARMHGEARSPGADFRIAGVGPLTSLVLGAVFGLLAMVAAAVFGVGLVAGGLGYLGGVNVLLAVFNLVPAAPLDGGRVLRAALWRRTGDRVRAAVAAARAGRVFGFVLVALGITQVVLGGGFAGVWLALIGLFLVHAASAEEQHTRLNARLHGVRMADVMTSTPLLANGDETVGRFVEHTVLTYRFSTYPLVDDTGRFSGLVTLNRIRGVPPDQRDTTRLADIACAADEVPTAGSDELLTEMLPKMTGCADGRVVVLDDGGMVIGIVTGSDISRVVQLGDLRGLDPYPAPLGADMTTPERGGHGIHRPAGR